MPYSRDEAEDDLSNLILSLICPHCQLEFTEGAAHWALGYLQGRIDTLDELSRSERSSVCRLRCEMCRQVSELNVLSGKLDQIP